MYVYTHTYISYVIIIHKVFLNTMMVTFMMVNQRMEFVKEKEYISSETEVYIAVNGKMTNPMVKGYLNMLIGRYMMDYGKMD